MPATITITPSGDLTEHDPLKFIEAITSAIGETVEEQWGLRATRLLYDFAATSTQAVVESTLGFPSAGAAWFAGIRFTYTSKTDGTFEGCVPDDPRVVTIPKFSDVTLDPWSVEPDDDTAFLSATDKAFRATLPHLSEGRWLTKLCDLFGLPISASWNANSTRAALRAAAYLPRARRPVLLAFLDGLFSHVETDVACTVSPVNPQRITATSGTPFDADADVGRWVRIGTSYYVIVSVGGSGSYATLSAYSASPYWLTGASFVASSSVTATLLAFAIEEPADLAARVVVKLWDAYSPVPATYLQPATTWLLYNFEGGAFTVGNYIEQGITGATGKIVNLVDNGTEGALQLSEVVGTFLDAYTIVETGGGTGFANANGSGGTQLLAYDGETGGGFSVGDTVVGATSGATGVIRGLQDDGTTGLLVIEYTTSAGTGTFWVDNENLEVSATVRGVANGDSRTLERPEGEPYGGGLTADELTSGAAKKPIYLIGEGTSPELRALIKGMLPGGFFVDVKRGGA